MKTKKQQTLKTLAKFRDELQNMRKRIDNRIGRKADGSQQDVDQRAMRLDTYLLLQDIANQLRLNEKKVESAILKELNEEKLWTQWLSKLKGVGPIIACWILGEFDIIIATTVSKLWQYAGMNPGLIFGKIHIDKKDYKPNMGAIVEEHTFKGKTRYIILSNKKVRGDRATKGFVLPYNKKLKSVLIGILAESFIKQKSSYKTDYYDPMKARLENEASLIFNPDTKHMRQDDGKAWSVVSKGHRDLAAKRFMVKHFLIDLYTVWRKLEGLPVREPYASEYLGKRHGKYSSKKHENIIDISKRKGGKEKPQ